MTNLKNKAIKTLLALTLAFFTAFAVMLVVGQTKTAGAETAEDFVSITALDNSKTEIKPVNVTHSTPWKAVLINMGDDKRLSNLDSYMAANGHDFLKYENCNTVTYVGANGAKKFWSANLRESYIFVYIDTANFTFETGDVLTIKQGLTWGNYQVKKDLVYICQGVDKEFVLDSSIKVSDYVYSTSVTNAKTEIIPANVNHSNGWKAVLVNMGDDKRIADVDNYMSANGKDFIDIPNNGFVTYTSANGTNKLWNIRFRENYIFIDIDTSKYTFEQGDILTVKAGTVWGDYQVKKDLVYICQGQNRPFTLSAESLNYTNITVSSLSIFNDTSRWGYPSIEVDFSGITGVSFGGMGTDYTATMKVVYKNSAGTVKNIQDFVYTGDGNRFALRIGQTDSFAVGDTITFSAGAYLAVGMNGYRIEKSVTYRITDPSSNNGYQEGDIRYTIVFKDYDGKVLSTATYAQGEKVNAPANPERVADKTYTYTFKGWDKTVTNATADAIYTATYTKTYIDYTIKFVDYDGEEISKATYHYGDTVTAPANPERVADKTYTYTFNGWDSTVVAVAGNKTYTATYTENFIDYVITFVNYDGAELSKETYHYGDTVTTPTTPVKPSNETYSYTFNGWDKEVVAVDGDATYTATYTENFIDYTIKFVDYNGDEISTATYHYGDIVTTPANPERVADKTYTYTFNGWDKEVVAVDGNKTYTAIYTENFIDYTIIFVNYDGTELSKATYHYGATVVVPEAPVKPSTNTYSYTFNGWDKEVVAVEGDATYTATYTENIIEYTITFVNYDGTELSKATYNYGETVVVPASPVKPATNTYTYTFNGWDSQITAVNCDKVYTATYTENFINYTVTFVDYDGTEISKQTYHYGDVVTAPANPERVADKTYTYTFNGWDSEVVAVAGDKTYTATYTENFIDYTVTFVDEDNSVISSNTYHYGDKVVMPEIPEKEGYSFNGWTLNGVSYDSSTPVTENITIKANWLENVVIPPEATTYTVIFKNYDGSILSSRVYVEGAAVIEPATPTRSADGLYTYTFDGWDNEVVAVVGDAIYTATYTKTYIEYTVTFIDYDGTEIRKATYHYGDTVTVPANPTRTADSVCVYTFNGWDKEVVAVDGNATYTATYTKTYIEYTVTFVNYDGTEISKATYHYGDTVTVPAKPVRPATNTFTYTFDGWDSEVVAVDGNATYTATYTETYIDYTIIFVNYDGAELSKATYHYGDTVTAPTTPVKPSTNTYSYTFNGWDKQVVAVDGNATYTAIFTENYIEYTVTFVDYNGEEISKATYHYGDTVTIPANPERVADNTYTYTFNGWDKQVVAVDGNATYTATYTETYINYTVTFVNYDGTELSTATYHYGDTVTVPATPVKPSTNTYSYTFNGWDKQVVAVDGDATYTATYTENYIEYTVTFVDYDGTELSKETYHYGDTVARPADPTRVGYIFNGWLYNNLSYNFNAQISKDITLVASWDIDPNAPEEPIVYTVTFDSNGGTAVASQTVTEGECAVEPVEPTKEGYTFNCWELDGYYYDFNEPVTGNITLVASWTQNQVTPPPTPDTPENPNGGEGSVTGGLSCGGNISGVGFALIPMIAGVVAVAIKKKKD